MNDSEKAQFVLSIISSEQVSISASMAKNLAECQNWLESLTKAPPLKTIKTEVP